MGKVSLKLALGLLVMVFLQHCALTAAALRVRASRAVVGSNLRSSGLHLRMSIADASSAAKSKKGKKPQSKYSASVLLPKTNFDQRANSLKKEPELQKFWHEKGIYEKLAERNTGEKFILHDGPPYANGDLHIGHALNKILKDFINKYQSLRGRKVRYVPGWDCHGLPIELKVLQSMKSKEREALTPITLRKKAAGFAVETMEKQRESFKRYGIWGDWDSPYLTLQPEYEAAQIRVFGEMVTAGHIYRGKKPVHWSPSSRTALAEAELEYPENHVSKSIYLGFKVVESAAALKAAVEEAGVNSDDIRVAIWTTTPWTIPANLAVAVNPDIDYCIASHPAAFNGATFLVAEDLAGTLGSKLGLEEGQSMTVHKVLKGADIIGTTYQHPLYDRQSKVIAGGDYITTASGTGLVHTAPGHGQEDYLTGLKEGLPLLSPVNDLGCFTEEAGERFKGLSVLKEGNTAVIEALEETGTLIKAEDYGHKYPYDWRTKKPTIFRATEQWFASVSTFREDALRAIDEVQWIPAVGKNRILGMTQGRGDWCISRQRNWGVPIPVFYNKDNNEPLMTPETLKHIENVFRAQGSDSWWELTVAELLPEALRDQADQYTKGTDTMDVWFDSGTSWAGVAQARDELSYPADLYLEGSDQHRGWFQSSLLTSVASQGKAPYKTVLTHGFVLDEKGYKMSKSVGNVVDPKKIIEGGGNQKLEPAYGADTLRLWISGVDYSGDVCIGDNIIKQVSDGYRKLRNTLRYLVGSLDDFEPSTDLVSTDQLASIDKYILGKLSRNVAEVEQAYDEYQFYKANQALIAFANSDLSAFYLDMAKDRLYVSAKSDPRRRACQTVIYHLLEQLSVLMAPIVPHMAEDVWQNTPYIKNVDSVFEKTWPDKGQFPEHEDAFWTQVRLIRNDVNKQIELMRVAKEVGANAECQVFLQTEDVAMRERLTAMQGDAKLLAHAESTNGMDDLRFILMTSQVTVVDSPAEVLSQCDTYKIESTDSESGLTIGVAKANGVKCDRCWYYSESVGEDHEHSDICLRCADVVRTDGFKVPAPEE
jgi:isoleucyl-tRNA synthetase